MHCPGGGNGTRRSDADERAREPLAESALVGTDERIRTGSREPLDLADLDPSRDGAVVTDSL